MEEVLIGRLPMAKLCQYPPPPPPQPFTCINAVFTHPWSCRRTSGHGFIPQVSPESTVSHSSQELPGERVRLSKVED